LLADARRAGVTQESVAKAGDLSGQNAISKLLANHNLGPSVETFIKAVKGLGKEVSVFFAEIEHAAAPPTDRPILDRIVDLELALEAIASSSQPTLSSSSLALGAHASPGATHRRPHGATSVSGSPSGVINNHISTVDRFDMQQFEAAVGSRIDVLAHRLERLTDHLEKRRDANGAADSGAPTSRARAHRRSRKTA